MDVTRNGEFNSFLKRTVFWLLVTAGMPLTACARVHGDADEPVEAAPVVLQVESSDSAEEASSHRPCWAARECGGETFLPASLEARHHPGRRGPRGFFMTLLSALSVLLLVFVWRRPCAATGKGIGAAATSPNDIVCLSCSRCGRVIDVRRDNLSRQLFCPRCGSTMPRDV